MTRRKNDETSVCSPMLSKLTAHPMHAHQLTHVRCEHAALADACVALDCHKKSEGVRHRRDIKKLLYAGLGVKTMLTDSHQQRRVDAVHLMVLIVATASDTGQTLDAAEGDAAILLLPILASRRHRCRNNLLGQREGEWCSAPTVDEGHTGCVPGHRA